MDVVDYENTEAQLPQEGRIFVGCGPLGNRLVELVKDVAFLAVLAEVKTLNFVFLAGPEAHQCIDDFQNDERADDSQDQRRSGGDQLIDQLS